MLMNPDIGWCMQGVGQVFYCIWNGKKTITNTTSELMSVAQNICPWITPQPSNSSISLSTQLLLHFLKINYELGGNVGIWEPNHNMMTIKARAEPKITFCLQWNKRNIPQAAP